MNMAFCGIFLNTTLRAAVHLGQDYDANLRYVKNHLWNSVGLLFHGIGQLISELKEITDVSTIDFQDATWMSTSFLCEKAYRITKARVHVFSDSVFCAGKMGDDPIVTWKSKIKWYSENNHFKDMNRTDGIPTEFEWKILRGITTLSFLEEIQKLMINLQCETEDFTERIIIMSMYNDIEWRAKGNKEICEYKSQTVADYARRLPRGHCFFLGPGSEEKLYGTYTNRPDGSWNQSVENMMANFSGSGHPIFRASSATERG